MSKQYPQKDKGNPNIFLYLKPSKTKNINRAMYIKKSITLNFAEDPNDFF